MESETIDTKVYMYGQLLPLEIGTLQIIIENIPDNPIYTEVFERISKSTTWQIREHISTRKYLSKKTISRLLNADKRKLHYNLFRYPEVIKKIKFKALKRLIKLNFPKLTERIAENLSTDTKYFNKIGLYLAKHDDPVIRQMLISNLNFKHFSKDIIELLLGDKDKEVSKKAKLYYKMIRT
ncbi:MAG: hypothetical protein DRG78_00975 [Epsilonproteobacteria bacterium]|nr:MAG: hypothetical protein DRG78_00975 [Campylobacterota bacterium]